MPTRSLLGFTFLLGAGLLAGTVAVVAAASPRPHIVYFLVDDLGYSDCGFMGGDDIRTPQIDRLAADGTTLTSFYVQPVCSPTRACLMTGRYGTHQGVYGVVRPGAAWGLPLDERTLATALSEAGYTTAICGKWHLGESAPAYLPTRRGFDHQYGLWLGMADHFTHRRDDRIDWHRNDQPLDEPGYSTQLITQEAVRVIDRQPAHQPLFLYVPFQAVHSPLQAPDESMRSYDKLPPPRRKLAGMLTVVDRAIGTIVAALEERGLRDDTLILFSSDNGGPSPGRITSNAPLRGGKGGIYEGGVRVCAFANWPAQIPAGERVDAPLHIVDIYPTLLRLTGAATEQSQPVDGKDIWPVLTAGADSPHDEVLLMGAGDKAPTQAAVRCGDWKLLRNPGNLPSRRRVQLAASPQYELYNLADDIGETNNLADEQPEKRDELIGVLERLTKDAVPNVLANH